VLQLFVLHSKQSKSPSHFPQPAIRISYLKIKRTFWIHYYGYHQTSWQKSKILDFGKSGSRSKKRSFPVKYTPGTGKPRYRRAITSFKIVKNCPSIVRFITLRWIKSYLDVPDSIILNKVISWRCLGLAVRWGVKQYYVFTFSLK